MDPLLVTLRAQLKEYHVQEAFFNFIENNIERSLVEELCLKLQKIKESVSSLKKESEQALQDNTVAAINSLKLKAIKNEDTKSEESINDLFEELYSDKKNI